VTRAAVVFPGRGSYTPASLGSLPRDHGWVRRADELRRGFGLEPISEIDAASQFDASVHLRPANASPLTFLSSLLDAERIAGDHEVIVVVSSSTGWYTALAAAGALEFDDAFRLVQEMGLAADAELPGGVSELIYPLSDEAWRPDPAYATALTDAFAGLNGDAHRSQELGPFAVVAGTREGIDRVAAQLPRVTLADRAYPVRLAMGDAWHTPLRADAADAAASRLGGLTWQRPSVTLVDGRGVRYTPWATDTAALEAYTLRDHPRSTYDFATSFRVALREYAPDVVLLPGPGATLGAACAQIIVSEGYAGIRSRAEFEEAQGGARPILLSVRR
jgi:[acyl-carrier-protein] S-malonyltransferase